MRRAFLILLSALLAGTAGLSAQERLEVRRVPLDSLVSFLNREFPEDFYVVKDEAEQATFSVSAPRGEFLDAAYAQLREKGYIISTYGDARFILRGKSVFTDLPLGLFTEDRPAGGDDGLRQYLSEQSAVATFQNKVYEIGEPGAKASGKAYLTGHVRDVSSGEPLTGVSVYDDKTGAYAVTDADGFYRVALPLGDGQLNLSGYSLEDMHLTLKVYDDGTLDVVMKEKVTALAEAVISADAVSHHRDAKMGIERVRMEVINKIPTAFGEGDIIHAVLTLPGVKSVGEASSGFNVRGGSTDQNLILLNDGTIYNPTHLFGIFSAFNPDVVSEVELYKSSIPAEFGGRISSVLDVRGREGNANKVAGALGLGLLTSRFLLEGPISKGKTTFIVGGRTTYSNWLLGRLPEDSNYHGGRASFSDLNASVTHKIDDDNTLQAYVYWSRDHFGFSRDTTFRYSNLNASLKWRSRLSSRLNLTAVAGYDQYAATLDNTLGENQLSGYRVATGIRQGFAKGTFRYAATDAHSLTFGAQATFYNLQPGAMSPLYEGSLVANTRLDPQNALEPSLFASDSWTVSPKLSFDAGVRLSGLLALNPSKFYLNPEIRLSGKYSFLDNLSFKAGFNTMSQHIHLISNTSSISPIDTWQLSTARVRPQTGWQAAAGLYWTVGSVDLTVEAYYKHTAHQLDYKSGATLLMNPDLPDYLVETYGRAYGVEVMAKKTSGKLTGWLSYTYARSHLREMQDRGVETINGGAWYNAPHDKPHEVKLVANYKFTHRYSVSANLEYSTGRPVTLPACGSPTPAATPTASPTTSGWTCRSTSTRATTCGSSRTCPGPSACTT